ncbi:MAG: Ig-like domain-containing protein, partial [Candidatus Helarchaeota archaeon]
MTVEGSAVVHSWDGSTVSYTPSTPFADGQVVDVTIDASDNVGNAMATYSWSFTIDISPPVASNEKPANNTYTSNTQPTIIVALSDAISDVDPSSIVLRV